MTITVNPDQRQQDKACIDLPFHDPGQQLKLNRGSNRRRAAKASSRRKDGAGGDLQKFGDCVQTPAGAPPKLWESAEACR